MELKQQRNFRDEPTSKCQSFGSVNLPCSQTRKISIGVMAEEIVRNRKGNETVPPKAKKTASPPGEKIIEENNKVHGVTKFPGGKEAEATTRENSPWVSTKSLRQETPKPTSVQFCENRRTSVVQSVDGTERKFNGTEAPTKEPLEKISNRTSVLRFGDGAQKQCNSKSDTPVIEVVNANQTSNEQSGDDMQKKTDILTYGRKREKAGRPERLEKFAFEAAQEVSVPDKGAEGKKEKAGHQRNESIKMKLWEILGTAPSQNELNSSSQTIDVGAKNPSPASKLDRKSSRAAKHKQNSDTIESDSENPNGTIRRPVTRLLTRRKSSTKAQNKLPAKNNKGGNLPSSFNSRQQCQEKNIFTFHDAEGCHEGLQGTGNGGSFLFSSKKSGRRSSVVEPRRINFFDKADLEKSGGSGSKEKRPSGGSGSKDKRPSPHKKTTSHCNRTESFRSHRSQSTMEPQRQKIRIIQEDIHCSPASKKINRQEDLKNPQLSKSVESQDNCEVTYSMKNKNQEDHVKSPTLRMKTPSENLDPSPPSPKVKPTEQDVVSPGLFERRFTSEGFCNFRTSQTPKAGSCGSDAQTESSENAERVKSPLITDLSSVERKDACNGLSQSSEEQDVESLPDLSINRGRRISETWTPELGNRDKPAFMLRSSKRLCSELNRASPSPKDLGTEEDTWVQGPSEQNHEDGLARAVSLFAFALEKFKAKMKAETSKRSSEILASAAEGIKSQLQQIDSHIQKDIEKFTTVSKSKRKRLETRSKEQQDRLKLIEEKFRKEIDQHLQECRNTLDDMEAYQIELKGNAEKQNTSHRKLLLQVEEEIGTQLSDAERRITAVQQGARAKMIQLKNLIAECLQDGVLS